jgi:hypothetical protein
VLRSAKPAQAQFSPEGCVFAANLADERSIADHQRDLHQLLDIFGKCHITVKHDQKAHPFAIVQFEEVAHAKNALINGKGMMCSGRHLRLEQGRVERTIVVGRVDPQQGLSMAEAREMLVLFGEIEEIYHSNKLADPPLAFPFGVVIKYKMWQDCQDALKGFTELFPGFRIQMLTGINNPTNKNKRGKITTSYGAIITPGAARANPEADNYSIYVGNLPDDTTREELLDIFGRFGRVKGANVVNKSYTGMNNNFSFVEFASTAAAEAALNDGISLRGNELRLEPKEYTSRRANRLALGERRLESETTRVVSSPSIPRHGLSPIRTSRAPFRLSAAANDALRERLAANTEENKPLMRAEHEDNKVKEEIKADPVEEAESKEEDGDGEAKEGTYVPPHRRRNMQNPY